MSKNSEKENDKESLIEVFIFETIQLLEQLEQLIICSEKDRRLESSINEIFRIMHTIKGSASMMSYHGISSVAHVVEDILNTIREKKPEKLNYQILTDIILEANDFIKQEISKVQKDKTYNPESNINIEQYINSANDFLSSLNISNTSINSNALDISNNPSAPGTSSASSTSRTSSTSSTSSDLSTSSTSSTPSVSSAPNISLNTSLKNKYKVEVFFEDGCQMENVRAYAIVHRLEKVAEEIIYYPSDILENDESARVIQKKGFIVSFQSNLTINEVKSFFMETLFLRELVVNIDTNSDKKTNHDFNNKVGNVNNNGVGNVNDNGVSNRINNEVNRESVNGIFQGIRQSMISVNTDKLDKLMDLVGELVISEAMVLQNPEVKKLDMEGFRKDVRQLQKITNELRDLAMSIRMVPLSMTFHRMNRIVRDMSNKLNKEVELEIIGEETEVDKNIIDLISDPLMHIIRNSIDHGIESVDERLAKGKPKAGKIVLEAGNTGGDVWINVIDDGNGLDKGEILKKAKERKLLNLSDRNYSDKEIYSFIFHPGFSTREQATEFSGRGVGLDVVQKNMEKLGGTVVADSMQGKGTIITMRIPLTMAIIDGMLVKSGKSIYTIPTISIKEFFKADKENVIVDTNGNEMIMVRGVLSHIKVTSTV